jgi:hypothetical protein
MCGLTRGAGSRRPRTTAAASPCRAPFTVWDTRGVQVGFAFSTVDLFSMVFVWARRARNSQNWRCSAWAATGTSVHNCTCDTGWTSHGGTVIKCPPASARVIRYIWQ